MDFDLLNLLMFGENISSIVAPMMSNIAKTSITATSAVTLANGDTFTDSGFIWSDTNSNPIFSV